MVLHILRWLGIMILFLLVAACSQDGSNGLEDRKNPSSSGFRVAMLLPGPADDMSWNTTGFKGLALIEQRLGATVVLEENVGVQDMEFLFTRYARQGYDLIIGHGGQFVPAAEAVAPLFPRTNFMVVGTDAGNNINLGAVQFIQEEIGFLAGAVAGLKTTSDKVAYVSGMPYAHMNEKGSAFVAGARHVNPEITARSLTLESWTNASRGLSCGQQLVRDGFDVIAVDADSAGLPIHALAQEAGVNTIGWATDQYALAPEAIVTSGVQRAETIILAGAELVRLGRWEGKLYKFGLKDGTQDLAPFRESLNEDQQGKIQEIRLDILDGSIDPVQLSERTTPVSCP